MTTLTSVEAALARGVRVGDQGPIVLEIRSKLDRAGFAPATSVVNPQIYDQELAQRVTAFQRAKGLGIDGIVGPQTWAALGGAPVSGAGGSLFPIVDQSNITIKPGAGTFGTTAKLAIGGAIAAAVFWIASRASSMADGPDYPGGGILNGLFGAADDETDNEADARRAAARAKRKAKEQAQEYAIRRAAVIASRERIDPKQEALLRDRIERRMVTGMSREEAEAQATRELLFLDHQREDSGAMARRSHMNKLRFAVETEYAPASKQDLRTDMRIANRIREIQRGGRGLPGAPSPYVNVMRRNPGATEVGEGYKPMTPGTPAGARLFDRNEGRPTGGQFTPPITVYVDPFKFTEDRQYRESVKDDAKRQALVAQTEVTVRAAPAFARQWASGMGTLRPVLWKYVGTPERRGDLRTPDEILAAREARKDLITKFTTGPAPVIVDAPVVDDPSDGELDGYRGRRGYAGYGDYVNVQLINRAEEMAVLGRCNDAAAQLQRVASLPSNNAERLLLDQVRNKVWKKCQKEVMRRAGMSTEARAEAAQENRVLTPADVAEGGGSMTIQQTRMRTTKQQSGNQKRKIKALKERWLSEGLEPPDVETLLAEEARAERWRSPVPAYSPDQIRRIPTVRITNREAQDRIASRDTEQMNLTATELPWDEEAVLIMKGRAKYEREMERALRAQRKGMRKKGARDRTWDYMVSPDAVAIWPEGKTPYAVWQELELRAQFRPTAAQKAAQQGLPVRPRGVKLTPEELAALRKEASKRAAETRRANREAALMRLIRPGLSKRVQMLPGQVLPSGSELTAMGPLREDEIAPWEVRGSPEWRARYQLRVKKATIDGKRKPKRLVLSPEEIAMRRAARAQALAYEEPEVESDEVRPDFLLPAPQPLYLRREARPWIARRSSIPDVPTTVLWKQDEEDAEFEPDPTPPNP